MKLSPQTQIMYPEHGVARVVKQEQKRLSSGTKDFFLIEVKRTEMKILVPVERVEDFRIRPLHSPQEINRLLATPDESTEIPDWARAYRENVEKIKTGEFLAVLSVYRQLQKKPRGKRTFGEQKILDTTRVLLTEEIQESYGCTDVEAQEKLEDAA